jgi:HKD family nuclease
MPKVNNLSVIENAGPNNLRDALCRDMRGANAADVAVAYVKAGGFDAIRPSLLAVASQGRVRVLTCLQFGITEPKALEKLLKLMNQTNLQLEARLSDERHFHAKGYYITKGKIFTAVVGSSNLTRDGLESEGELNLKLSVPSVSSIATQLRRPFEQQWNNGSVRLSAEIFEEYGRRWKVAQAAQKRSMISLEGLLRLKAKKLDAKPKGREVQRTYWRDWVNTPLGKSSELIVDRATNWENRGWTYSALGRNKYNVGDRILLFDLGDGTIQAVEVKGRTEISTPDGRHFVAYRSVPRTEIRNLTKSRWKTLKGLAVVRRQADASRRVIMREAKWRGALAVVR